MQAIVQAVQTAPGGDYPVALAPAGSTTIAFDDASDFAPKGGQVTINGTTLTYTAVDLDEDQMILADPLLFDVDEQTFVAAEPPTETAYAVVAFADQVVTVEVPHGLKPMLAEGMRAPGDGEVVLLEEVDVGAYRIVDVVGSTPMIIAGDPSGARVQITRDGLRVFVVGPNGMPYEAVSMTNGAISFSVMDQGGSVLGGIASDGSVAGTSGSYSKDVRIKGLPVVGQLGGGVQAGWLDQLPRSMVAWNGRAKYIPPQPASSDGFRYLNVTADLHPGRRYRVFAQADTVAGAADGARITLSIRHASGPVGFVPPESAPPLGPIGQSTSVSTVTGMHCTPSLEGFYEPAVEESRSFVIHLVGYGGAMVEAFSGMIYVEDVGPSTPLVGGDDTGAGQTLYQSTWRATASRTYDMGGTAITDGSITSWNWLGDPMEINSSAWIYGEGCIESTDAIEFGKTLPQALTGATLWKAEIYLRNQVWYSGPQGWTVLGSLTSASLPTSKVIDGSHVVEEWQSGEGMWIEVPTSWFTNGANVGVTLGDHNGWAFNNAGALTALASGSFAGPGDADPPRARFTYTR